MPFVVRPSRLHRSAGAARLLYESGFSAAHTGETVAQRA